MGIPCNVCPATGRWSLKLIYLQAMPPGWDPKTGRPRVAFTVETEGLYCDEHKQIPVAILSGPFQRAQVDTWFQTRNLGKASHAETSAEWKLAGTEGETPEAETVKVRM